MPCDKIVEVETYNYPFKLNTNIKNRKINFRQKIFFEKKFQIFYLKLKDERKKYLVPLLIA